MHMTPMSLVVLLLIGSVIGVISGMLGIGGGVLVIPALVLGFGFSQQQAIGTSLGMLLPPIGIFAFMAYWRAGQVNVPAAGTLALGFALGAWGGSILVTSGRIPHQALRDFFGLFLLYIAWSILFEKHPKVHAVLFTVSAAAWFGFRGLGRRWTRRFSLEETFREQSSVPVAPDYEI